MRGDDTTAPLPVVDEPLLSDSELVTQHVLADHFNLLPGPATTHAPHTLPAMFPDLEPLAFFDDLVRLSTRRLKRDAFARAADAAMAANDRFDLGLINDDVVAATSTGLLALIRHKQSLITERVQPGISARVPPPDAEPSIPPYPHQLGLGLLDSFHAGADIVVPDPLPARVALRERSPAEHMAIERHIKAEYSKGLLILLPDEVVAAACAAEGLAYRVSPTFVQGKVDSDPVKEAMGRKCDDYSLSGLNSPLKAAILAETYGAYNDPTVTTLASTFLRAKTMFPSQDIHIATSDFTAYYKRFLIAAHHVPLLATSVEINGVTYAALPLVGPFGLQDSNAMAKCTTEAIHAIVSSRHRERWGAPIQTTYVDDTIAFGPPPVLDQVLAIHEEVADSVLGLNSVSRKKTKQAPVLDALGFRFDCPAATVGLTSTWFEKLVAVLFHELPTNPAPGHRVMLRLLQRAASYMLRTAEVVSIMRPWSRGLYRAIARVTDHPKATARLTRDAIADITEWRRFARSCWTDASRLRVPMEILPLTNRLHPAEPREERWARQSRAAHEVVFVDACTTRPDADSDSWGAGWVAFDNPAPPTRKTATAYGTYLIPRLQATVAGMPVENSDLINVYEFLASLIALTVLAARGRPTDLPMGAVWHVHVWTDNSSALAWLTSHKSSHPLIIHLLRTLADIQSANGLLVTMGHVPGRVNTFADDSSRGFRTATGTQSLATLSHLIAHTQLPPWWHATQA